jgi:hypothetical protein
MRRSLSLLLVAALAGPAAARSEKTLAYQRAEVWPAAVRFLVVEEHLKITEKDADAGYVLFELLDDGKPYRGSLEVMSVVVDGQTEVRFVLQIADRPSWIEVAMLTRLERKLHSELGSPSPPPTKADPKDPKDPKPSPGKDAPAKDAPKPDDGAPPVSPTP